MFQVTDISATENELKSQGVIVVNRMAEDYGTIITIEDLDKNWLEFYEPKDHQPIKD